MIRNKNIQLTDKRRDLLLRSIDVMAFKCVAMEDVSVGDHFQCDKRLIKVAAEDAKNLEEQKGLLQKR